VGNRAVAQLLAEGAGSRSAAARSTIQLAPSTVEAPPTTEAVAVRSSGPAPTTSGSAGGDGTVSPFGALDDPSFNADAVAHDLLRAIDQQQYNLVLSGGMIAKEDVAKEHRNIDAPKVISCLEGLTAAQIAEVKRRYFDFEKWTTLEQDLFGTGQSGRTSNLTPDQQARIQVLLQGTKGDPTSASVIAELKRYPPETAARIRAALGQHAADVARMHQIEADAIEVHELFADKLDGPKLERVMLLHRRPLPEIDALDAFYDNHYGAGVLATDIHLRLSGLQLMRMTELREGNTAGADACAIEDKRRQIDELNRQEQQAKGGVLNEAASYLGLPAGGLAIPDYLAQERAKRKEELTAGIESIIEQNRQEALADTANAGKQAGVAIAERLTKILGQQDGDPGNTLESQLTATLGAGRAAAITTAAKVPRSGGSDSLIESAAAALAETERSNTTTAEAIIAVMRSMRSLAKHDVLARVHDPSVALADKQAIGADPQGAINHLAHTYVDAYEAAYNRLAGTEGRNFQAILASATSDADATYLEDLRLGGGETSDLAELQRAVGNKDVEAIKAVLRKQSDRTALDALVAQYNEVFDTDLHRVLFGRMFDQDVTEVAAEAAEKTWSTGGLVVGRDAAQIAEILGRPAAARSGEAKTAGEAAFGPGYDEVAWMVARGQREFDVTMGHRGVTGHMREWTGDPETERILKASREKLHDLQQQWEHATSPAEKHHWMLEIRKTRAALSLDADAYEKDNERVLGEIRSVLSFAVSIALAIALPGAGAGLVAFLESTALNIAANVAANVVIKGDDYSWADLKGDLIGGALGAGGAKFGEELLGRVAVRIAGPAAKATAGATEKIGIETALAREVTELTTAGEKVAVSAGEMEAAAAGREVGAATKETSGEIAAGAKETAGDVGAATKETSGEIAAGTKETAGATGATSPAAPVAATKGLAERGARELGGFFGGIFGGKLYSGDMGLSLDEVLQALAATLAGKAAHHEPAAGHGPAKGATGEHEPGRVPGERPAEEPSVHDAEEQRKKKAEEEEVRTREQEELARKTLEDVAFLPVGVPKTEVIGPRTAADMLAERGIPPKSAEAFQAVANDYNAVIKVRPTNVASLPVLEGGGIAKPELIKAKTVNKADLLLGAPQDGIGKVGFFDPVMPGNEILEAMRPDERQRLKDRFEQRREEFQHFHDEYTRLQGEGLIRIENGVVQIADPRTPTSADAPHGQFKDIGGDHDLYEITDPDGHPLPEAGRRLVVEHLRSLGVNVNHPDHVSWKTDSPETHDPKADEAIRAKHAAEEPLVAFVPKSAPREVFAGETVTGPRRTPGQGDPHRPATGASFYEPKPGDPGYEQASSGDGGDHGGSGRTGSGGARRDREPTGCFVAGTLVHTPEGGRPIATLRPGDLVIGSGPHRLDRRPCRVRRAWSIAAKAVLDVSVGEETLTVTGAHPFWVPGVGWQEARALTVGSVLQDAAGSHVSVTDIGVRAGAFTVYNLEVADSHTFHVGNAGVLVHNKADVLAHPMAPAELHAMAQSGLDRVPDVSDHIQNMTGWDDKPRDPRPELRARLERARAELEELQRRAAAPDAGPDELRAIEGAQERVLDEVEDINRLTDPVRIPTPHEQELIEKYVRALNERRNAQAGLTGNVPANDPRLAGARERLAAANAELEYIEEVAVRHHGVDDDLGRLLDHIDTLTEIRGSKTFPARPGPGSPRNVEGFGRRFNCESARFPPFAGMTFTQIETAIGRPPDRVSGVDPTGGTKEAFRAEWTFADGSSVHVDVPSTDNKSPYMINREAHAGRQANEPNSELHLTDDGIGVPTDSTPAHILIRPDPRLRELRRYGLGQPPAD
jgi:hypothetical protein